MSRQVHTTQTVENTRTQRRCARGVSVVLGGRRCTIQLLAQNLIGRLGLPSFHHCERMVGWVDGCSDSDSRHKKKKSEYPAAIFECQERLLLGLGHDHFGIRKVIKTLHSQLGVEFYIKWIVASREIKRIKSMK